MRSTPLHDFVSLLVCSSSEILDFRALPGNNNGQATHGARKPPGPKDLMGL